MVFPHEMAWHSHGAAHVPQIVKRGLKTNGIGYVMLETGRKVRSAVSSFLTDDACRVFLLSLRQGAAGLTLVSVTWAERETAAR